LRLTRWDRDSAERSFGYSENSCGLRSAEREIALHALERFEQLRIDRRTRGGLDGSHDPLESISNAL
jgi:hypothetical protein